MARLDASSFVSRDWGRVARAKEEYWRDRIARLGPAEALRVMSELRRHAQLLDPSWPTDEERAQDLETHRRVSAALAKARLRSR